MAERGTRVEIDFVELEKLCVLHCSDREIADWFGVSLRTIERRRHEPEFAAVMDRGRSKGKISVRRMQMKLLEAGNCTMAIWLGKNMLGQSDHVAHDIDDPLNRLLQIMPMPKIWEVESEPRPIAHIAGPKIDADWYRLPDDPAPKDEPE